MAAPAATPPAAPRRVIVTDSAGNVGEIAAGDLLSAENEGYAVATPEDLHRAETQAKYGGALGVAASAGLGAARGATLGLSDPLAVAIGGEDARKALAGYQTNPLASGAGEILGTVASIIASGGSGAVARGVAGVGAAPRLAAGLGRAVERGAAHVLGEGASVGGRLARSLATHALGGAAEASAYGAGQAVSEATLGEDHELTGEKLLASMGHAAAFGGALAGGTTLPFALAGEAGRGVAALARKGASYAREVGEGAVDAAGRGGTKLRELAGGLRPRLTDIGLGADEAIATARREAPGLLSQLDRKASEALPSSEELQRMSDEHAWRSTYSRKKFTDEANARAGGADKVGRILKETGVLRVEDGTLANALSPDDLLPRIEEAKGRVGQELGGIVERSQAVVKAGDIVGEVERVIEPLRSIAGREGVVSSLEGYRDSLIDKLGARSEKGRILVGKGIPVQELRAQRIGLQDIAYKEAKALDPAARVEFLRGIRGAMDDLEVNALVAEGADASTIATLKRHYQGLRIAEDATRDAIVRGASNRSIGATDYLAFIGGGGGVTGASAALLNKVARERGSAALSVLLEDLAKTRSIGESAKKLGIEGAGKLSDIAEKLQLKERSVEALGHLARATDYVTKRVDEGVKAFVEGAQRGGAIALQEGKNVAGRAAAAGERVAGTVRDVAASAGRAAAVAKAARSAGYVDAYTQFAKDDAPKRPPPREVEAMAREMIAVSQNPSALVARTTQMLGAVPSYAPNVGVAMSMTATNAAQFLAAKAPRGRVDGSSPTIHLERPRYTASDLSRFTRYVEAIGNPLSVLDDMQRGKLSRDSVEAVKAVYPKLYEEIRTKVVKGISNAEKPPPYEKKIQLGVLFDAPTDWSLEPDAMRDLQASYAQNGAEAEIAPQTGQDSGPARPLSGKIAGRMQTETERLEGDS